MSLGLRHQSRLIPLLRVTAKTFAQLFRPKLAEFPVKMDFYTFMICMGFYHSMQVLVFCLNYENSSSSTQLSLLHFSGTSIGTNNSLPVFSLPDQQAIPFFLKPTGFGFHYRLTNLALTAPHRRPAMTCSNSESHQSQCRNQLPEIWFQTSDKPKLFFCNTCKKSDESEKCQVRESWQTRALIQWKNLSNCDIIMI